MIGCWCRQPGKTCPFRGCKGNKNIIFAAEMNRRNYQSEMDRLVDELQQAGRVPTLLLHVCCAPCSSYCLEYLSRYFETTVLFYNPNISPLAEYQKRMDELKRFVGEYPFIHPVKVITSDYTPSVFYESVKGLENEPERGRRCHICYRIRLEETARLAAENHFDYFATTLTLSPLKDAGKINEKGEELGEKYQTAYLPSDFKKKEGYKRSIVLSAQYKLYRQNYCGCVFSKKAIPESSADQASQASGI